MTNKASIKVKVHTNSVIQGGYYRLELDLDDRGSAIFRGMVPGQFAEFDISNVSLPDLREIPEHLADVSQRHILLRRPFSFSAVKGLEGGKIRLELLYCVVGPATLRMTTLAKGDTISMLGPLGNGFSIPEGMDEAILVAGGMGAPPLLHLASYLKNKHTDVRTSTFVGARTVGELPFDLETENDGNVVLSEFESLSVPYKIATDDGSFGFSGFVTACLEEWLKEKSIEPDKAMIYGCGPEGMLAELAKLAAKHSIDCQVSMERLMACGIGLCQSCAVKVHSGAEDDGEYKLCCKDGPVFDSREVIFRNQE